VDPLLLEALRFGLAILAGGFVAIVAQRRAFEDARRLEAERTASENAQLARALLTEISENIGRLRPDVPPGTPSGPVTPTAPPLTGAWERARVLELTEETRALIGNAYAVAAAANAAYVLLESRLAMNGGKLPPEEIAIAESLERVATWAVAAFEAARDALSRPE